MRRVISLGDDQRSRRFRTPRENGRRRSRWTGLRHLRLPLVVTALLSGRGAFAQSAVSGELSIVERPGAPTRDLGNAVVYLVPSDGARAAASAGEAPADTASIDMRRKEYQPHVRVVTVPGAVAFPNRDPFSHNVFSNAPLGSFDLGLYRRGASRSALFTRTGVYPIYCNIHAKMVAFVVAVPTRHAAHPDRSGRFALTDVPAGSYVLHAWHERAGEITRPLTVPAGGVSDLRIALDARAYVAVPHPNKFGGAYTSMRADRY